MVLVWVWTAVDAALSALSAFEGYATTLQWRQRLGPLSIRLNRDL